MSLIAKPVVKNQFWIVTQNGEKVGNVIAEGSGYEVKLNGVKTHFDNTKSIEKKADIEFQKVVKSKTTNEKSLPFSVYPTTGKVFNSMFDIKRKIHLFTKTQKSKCYYAAGYFTVQHDNQMEVVFCPKYIFIQRYPFNGPYKTENEAKAMINI